MSIFSSIIIIILLLSFLLTLVISSRTDINDNYVDSSLAEESIRRKSTIQILDPTNNLRELLKQSTCDQIWVVLAYSESCERSMELLWRLRHYAVPKIEFGDDEVESVLDENKDHRQPPNFENHDRYHPTITFVPMQVTDNEADKANDDSNEYILGKLGIVRLPSLFFLLDEEKSHMASSDILSEEEENDNVISIYAKAQIYHGLSETVDNLVHGLYFYLLRLRLRLRSRSKQKQRQSHNQSEYEYIDWNFPLTLIRVESLRELQTIISNSDRMILQKTPLPLDPDLSKDEDLWIRYLMDDTPVGTNSLLSVESDYAYEVYEERINEKKESEAAQQQLQKRSDSFRIVVQCRMNSQMPSTIESYEEFERAVKVLGARRNVLFSVLELDKTSEDYDDQDRNSVVSFCNLRDDDGLVAVWDGSLLGDDELFSVIPTTTTIVDGLSSWLRPLIFWFDRRFASIAFHPRYRRHAILFVDFHDRASAAKMRETIRIFRNECRRRRRNSNAETDDALVVCLVVPSTEIRIMTTFGIDIWTDLDQKATEKIRSTVCGHDDDDDNLNGYNYGSNSSERCSKNAENTTDIDQSAFSSILPVLLVTDRRKEDGTIQRHYLDPPITKTSIGNFINDVIRGLIEPEKKCGRIHQSTHNQKIKAEEDNIIKNEHKIPANKHGIHLLTADSLSFFLKTNVEKHVLLQLYAPTCGHCKRFNTVWNTFGDLIEYLGWSDMLLLARIDVTSNEIIVPGMVTANWLPSLFYFGMGVCEYPIHYGETIVANELELGGISDPLDLIEWWMDNAGFSTRQLEDLRQLLK